MGAGSYEKDKRLARIALIGAVRRLDAVMVTFEKFDIALWPSAAGEVPDWTPEHMALVKNVSAAWAELVRRRQDWESAARTAGAPSTWPHT